MSTVQLARRAIQLWPGNRYNQRAWIRSVLMLGDRWLLAQRVRRPQ